MLLLVGGGLSLYCLWRFRGWLGQPHGSEIGAAHIQRIEVLVDELLATAEATSSVVQEKAEALQELIDRADRRLRALEAAVEDAPLPAPAPAPVAAAVEVPAAAPAPAPVSGPSPLRPMPLPASLPADPVPVVDVAGAPEPAGQTEVQRKVYTLADQGQDVTAIARRLGMTKGAVQLMLSLRR